jgi:hypothetical protein
MSFLHTLSSLMHTREGLPGRSPIAPNQTRLTLEFFCDELPEKKLQLISISILIILLSFGPGCHNILCWRTPATVKEDTIVDVDLQHPARPLLRAAVGSSSSRCSAGAGKGGEVGPEEEDVDTPPRCGPRLLRRDLLAHGIGGRIRRRLASCQPRVTATPPDRCAREERGRGAREEGRRQAPRLRGGRREGGR